MTLLSSRYHSICGWGVPMALQVRVSTSPAVSIGLLSTVSSVASAMVGGTAEYVIEIVKKMIDCVLSLSLSVCVCVCV